MKAKITVQNLKCGGCAASITNRLTALAPISGVDVEQENARVSFNYENPGDVQLVLDQLNALGYPSIDNKNSIAKQVKSFISCTTGRISK